MVMTQQSSTGAISLQVVKASTRFDWIFVFLSAWWIGGVFVDGWAHNHLARLETFFTPWHAILYTGFLVVVLFLLFTLVRNHAQGYSWAQALPPGYGLSLLGVGVFAVGGVCDMFWHLLFGVEVNTQALFSPTHLMLGLGAMLAVSGPLRSVWQRPVTLGRQTFLDLLPAILSLTWVLAILVFFTQYVSALLGHQASKPDLVVPFQPGVVELGLVAILFQTAIFMGVVLFAMRRWQLPLGTFTVIYGVTSALISAQERDLPLIPQIIVAALLSGFLVDLLYQVIKPTIERRDRIRLFAFLAPVVIQGIYFLSLFVTSGIDWDIQLWLGSIILSGVVGLLLSFLLVTLPVPQE